MAVCFASNEREFRSVFRNEAKGMLSEFGDKFPDFSSLFEMMWKSYQKGYLPTAILAEWPSWTKEQVKGMCYRVWKSVKA